MLFKPENAHVNALFSLKGKVAFITGGSRGIGLGAAIGLAEAGADIAITYNSSSPEAMKKLADSFEQYGVRFKAYKCNVSSKAAIETTTREVLADFGRLDIVVPNAGICIHEPAEDFSEEDFRTQMSVNLDGAYYTAQAAAKVFKEQKAAGTLDQGRIVFTASISSMIVNYPQKQAPYNASKAGLVRLATCLAVEWIDFARVNCVSPGYIDTDMVDVHPPEWKKTWGQMIPAQRMCQTYELKGVYVFLASDASSYMTGAELVVGGGYTLT
ncbi:hypothetical protein KL921_004597 [Ogataea angusta]|nr:hypothetical protein KL921_004597 [Ogataea angusta]KAG7854999.1 hypothetical protein KL939_004748 [Ogataea angusta]